MHTCREATVKQSSERFMWGFDLNGISKTDLPFPAMLAGGEQPAWCCDICCAEQFGAGGAPEQRICLSAYSKDLYPYSSQVLCRLSLNADVDTDSWVVLCFQADPCSRPTGQCCVAVLLLRSCCDSWRLPGASCLPWLGHDNATLKAVDSNQQKCKSEKGFAYLQGYLILKPTLCQLVWD